jgi:hypothetical protein
MHAKWKRLSFGAGLAWLAGIVLAEPLVAGEALALVDVDIREQGIEVVGTAVAITSGEYQGEMIIDRKGRSGSVSTRQSRDIALSAGERADIARVGVSFQPGDKVTVTVVLRRDGSLISQAVLSTGEN